MPNIKISLMVFQKVDFSCVKYHTQCHKTPLNSGVFKKKVFIHFAVYFFEKF